MVRYVADYQHKEPYLDSNYPGIVSVGQRRPATKSTYNILLEFGDYDLDEFFGERLPPVFDPEVERFWKGLFEVAHTVEGIHNLHICAGGTNHEYHGY